MVEFHGLAEKGARLHSGVSNAMARINVRVRGNDQSVMSHRSKPFEHLRPNSPNDMICSVANEVRNTERNTQPRNDVALILGMSSS